MKTKNKKAKRESKALAKKESTVSVKAEVDAGQLSHKEAEALQGQIKEGFKLWERNVISTAAAVDKFRRGRGWIALGYQNMTEWREKEIGYADFYYLRNVQKLLEEGVPAEAVEKMRVTNINTMARTLPPKEWKKPEWQEAAAKMATDKFSEKAHGASDEMGQHVELQVARGFHVAKSVADNWDLALKVAEMIDGAESMERRIEAIVSNYLNSPSESAGKNKLQAYEAMDSEEAEIAF